MALHRLPRAARGDAHLLVVVPDRAAGSERVAEPEPVLGADCIRVIGESRGALVRGDDEIGVVVIVPSHLRGRHDRIANEVVGKVEQRAQIVLVAGHALLQVGVTIRRRGRALEHEAALAAGRHDDDILHDLRLHQAEDLGTEVLRAVGPSQAAARDPATAQMHALEARAVDEDLEHRPRLRHAGHLRRVELERQERPPAAVGSGPPEIRSPSRVDHRDVLAKHAILVQVRDLLQRSLDRGLLPRRRVVVRTPGLQAQAEQRDQHARDRGMRGKRLLDERLRQREPDLSQVAAVRTQHDDLVGGKPREQHQSIEIIALDLAREHARERFLEQRSHFVDIDVHVRGDQPVIVQPCALCALRRDPVRPLLDDRQSHALEHRQSVRQWNRSTFARKLETQRTGARVDGAIQVDRDVAAGNAPSRRARCRARRFAPENPRDKQRGTRARSGGAAVRRGPRRARVRARAGGRLPSAVPPPRDAFRSRARRAA